MSFLFPSSTITLDAALRDIAQGSPRARAAAAHALGDVSEPTEKRRAFAALIVALDDDRPEVRAEACNSLGELRDGEALPHLLKRLDDGAPAVRQSAAIALGTLALPEAFEALAAVLKSGPADLRFQAATSLAEVDTARSFEPIAAALEDSDPQVVGAAALSLGAIGDARAIPLLTGKLEHVTGGVQFDVAYALAELGESAGRKVLVAALVDAERAWDAVSALAMVGDVLGLREALFDKKVRAEATILAAGGILKRAPGDEPARRVLLAALGARKTHLRGLAVEQLAAVGGAWAKAPLEKLADSRKGADLVEPIALALEKLAERA